MRLFKPLLVGFAILFLIPSALATGWWVNRDQPWSWSRADWSSSGLLADESEKNDALVMVLAARTGGLKGALSVHSWLVLREAGSTRLERYDKVGWGQPIRVNRQAPDGRWYSNEPWIVGAIRGEDAERLMPDIKAAITAYPYSGRGDYTVWPGPNSNTFVAHVLRAVPDLDIVLPPEAVGRDYRPLSEAVALEGSSAIHASLAGLLGIRANLGGRFELQVLGLVTGFDLSRQSLLIPGFGELGLN